MKPSILGELNHFSFQVRSNNCNLNSPPNEFARKNVDKAGVLISENFYGAIPEIILRTDKLDINKNENEFNEHLKEMPKEKKIFFVIIMKKSRWII